MENKFSKEYAEKLALEIYPISHGFENTEINYNNLLRRFPFISGYMKAIEETAAPDLLEALVSLRKWAISKGISIDGKLIINADNAINKAHGK